MKAMNFQDDIPPFLKGCCRLHRVLVYDLTSTQDATENWHYQQLVGELLRLELIYTFPVPSVKKFVVVGKCI